ncbi:MAG: CoA-binding protein [Halobacteriota archaeon]|nr:CoA-binding protein [Halobacteriota archaeon]
MTKKDIVTELEPLFYPRGVAIVGASKSLIKIGTMTLLSIIVGGFEGGIYPVNRKGGKILGVDVFKDFKSLPDDADLLVVCVPAAAVPQVMEDGIDAGIGAAVIISSGFAEAGEEGKKLEDEVVRVARNGGIRFVGPNCMGICSSPVKLYPLMNMMMPLPGDISFVSQSGTLGTINMLMASNHGIGFNKFVSSGNEADLKAEDLIEYYAKDQDSKIILSFIEGLRKGRKFFEVSKEATKKKPLIMLKAGVTKEGAKAANSHTGSLAGSVLINDVAFRQAGVVKASNGTEMLELVKAFSLLPIPKGNRVGIVTGGGGAGVLAADACGKMGLEVPHLPQEMIDELSEFLPPFWSHGNPIDITASGGIGGGGSGGADFSVMTKCLEALMECDEIDSVICQGINFSDMMDTVVSNFPEKFQKMLKSFTGAISPMEIKMNNELIAIKKKYGKPIVLMGMYESLPKSAKQLEEHGIIMYSEPDLAATTLSKLAWYGNYLKENCRH